MGIGNCISSDAFSVGGHLWKIQFYPDGRTKLQYGAFVSVFVKLVSEYNKDLRAWYEFYLLDHNGNRWRRFDTWNLQKMDVNRRCMDGPYILNVGQIMGYDDFCLITKLDELKFIKDDYLTIQCSVSVAKPYMDVPQMFAQPLPLSDLKQSYEKLLENGEETDVSFVVEGDIFHAHKIILSTRSPVFKAMLFGPLKDDCTQCIKVEEMHAPIFKALLRFIYCDAIPNLDSSDCVGAVMTQHLLAAADRYGIQTLKSICESRLCEDISIENVASTLALAEQHGCYQLKSRCLKFIGLPENLEGVMQTDGFKNLNESCPGAICELLQSVVLGRDFSSDANAKPV